MNRQYWEVELEAKALKEQGDAQVKSVEEFESRQYIEAADFAKSLLTSIG